MASGILEISTFLLKLIMRCQHSAHMHIKQMLHEKAPIKQGSLIHDIHNYTHTNFKFSIHLTYGHALNQLNPPQPACSSEQVVLRV